MKVALSSITWRAGVLAALGTVLTVVGQNAAQPAPAQPPANPPRQQVEQGQQAAPQPAAQAEQQQQVQEGGNLNQAVPGAQQLRNVMDNRRSDRASARPGAALAGAIHEPFQGPLTARKIQIAIDDAVAFLRAVQAPDGSIEENLIHYSHGAGTAMSALAMLAAGADPNSDESLRKALDWLAKNNEENTYFRAVRSNVWEYALRKVPYNQALRTALDGDYQWLVKALANKEGWRYQMNSTDWDNSCTQYGVLGVWAAARGGIDPGDEFWKRMSTHFRKFQNEDGGWGYTGPGSSANMATAGLASMFLVFDMYHGKTCYTAKEPRTFSGGEVADCLKAIARGMRWLGQAGGSNEDGYYLYGIERAGVASGRKYIGDRDWFAEGAAVVLARQRPDGSIPMQGYGQVIVNTGLSTLFLVYGGAPVAFNKLEYGEGQDWNLNPRDLANLTRELWSAYERPLNWHSVGIKAAASEFEAPVLFISGSQPAVFADEEVKKLREYLDRGGTILAEPSDHAAPFAESMTKLLERLFPAADYPACKLTALPPDHGVYTVIKQDWKQFPKLLGAGPGTRTCFFLSTEYLSGEWQQNHTDSDAFKLATNLLFYATDLGELAGKFASPLPITPPAAKRETAFTVARVRYASAGDVASQWDTARLAWRQFAPYLEHLTGCKVEEKPPVRLGQDKLDGVRLLHLTGQADFTLSEAERAALKKFVADGGTVLADAYAGAPAFAAAARRELEAACGKLAPLDNGQILASGRFAGGEDLSRKIGFKLEARRLLRARNVSPEGQKLEVVIVDKRPAVVFSTYDLSAALSGATPYRALGYKADSARRVVGNLVAYLMAD